MSTQRIATLEAQNAALASQLQAMEAKFWEADEDRQRFLQVSQKLSNDWRLERDMLAAVKHTVVATIGGTVEGQPTQEINYLQRLRELVRTEKKVAELERELTECRKERK